MSNCLSQDVQIILNMGKRNLVSFSVSKLCPFAWKQFTNSHHCFNALGNFPNDLKRNKHIFSFHHNFFLSTPVRLPQSQARSPTELPCSFVLLYREHLDCGLFCPRVISLRCQFSDSSNPVLSLSLTPLCKPCTISNNNYNANVQLVHQHLNFVA